ALAQAKPHRARKDGVEDQKVRDRDARVRSRSLLVKRFVPGTAHQDRHPVSVVYGSANLVDGGEQNVVFDVKNSSRLTGSLEILAKLEEVPGLAMRHRPFADPRHELVDVLDLAVESTPVVVIQGTSVAALHPQIVVVQPFPAIGADHLADVSRVLSRGG